MFKPKFFLTILSLLFLLVVHAYSQVYSEKIDMILPEEPAKYTFSFHALHEFHLLEKEINELTRESYRSHSLGDEVALRMHLFEQRYTYTSEPAPGAFSGQKVIRKPVLYHSALKIENHIKKQVRKGKMSQEEGEFILKFSLEYAIVLLHQNTETLEETLKTIKSVQEMIHVFESIELR